MQLTSDESILHKIVTILGMVALIWGDSDIGGTLSGWIECESETVLKLLNKFSLLRSGNSKTKLRS